MTKKKFNFQDIEALVYQGESDALEFKKSTAELHSVGKTLCGLLNRNGGNVLIGVTDNKHIIGQDVSDHTQQEIANLIKKIEPAPRVDIDYIQINNSSRRVIILTTYHDENAKPYTFEGKAFDRIASSTFSMPQERYHRLLLETTQKNQGWEDGIAKEVTLDHLNHEEILKTIQEGVSNGRIASTKLIVDPLEALTRLQLVKNNHFINAAIVLFAKEPTQWLPQCRLRLARFHSNDKRNFLDNRQVQGNAVYLLKEALLFVQRHLPIASYFAAGKIERIDAPLVPIEALREIFVNAICHRSYRSPGSSISCAIYDDRLEVWNEGSLPEGFSFSELKALHESRPRNPRIAWVFYCRKLFESWGGGITLISTLCKQAGHPEPEFFERSGGFCVRLFFKYSMQVSQATAETIAAFKLKPRQKEILGLLSSGKKMSVSEIYSQLLEPPSIRTVKGDLALLQKQKLVEPVGKGRTTVWIIRS
jgi:ATP-dependent DNA helicase RecG